MTALNVSVEAINPKIAEEYLRFNSATNRRVNQPSLKQLISDMKNGRFIENGDTIRFDHTGRLIDGQHRLLAILATGVTATMVVVRGLEAEAMRTIDTGQARTAAQLLKITGGAESNHATLAAIARAVIMYRDDQLSPSKPEIVEFVSRHEDELQAAAHISKPAAKLYGGAIGAYGSAAYILQDVSAADTREFFTALVEGAGLAPGNPVLALRNFLTSSKPLKASSKYALLDSLNPIFKSWNKWRTGESLRRVAVKSTSFTEPI